MTGPMASPATRHLALAIMGTALAVIVVCGATWAAAVGGLLAPTVAGWVIVLTDVAGVLAEAVLVLVGADRAVAARHVRPLARNWLAVVVLGSLVMSGIAQARSLLLVEPAPAPQHPAPAPTQAPTPIPCGRHPTPRKCLGA